MNRGHDVDTHYVSVTEGEWAQGNQHWLNSIMVDEYQPLVDTTPRRRPQIQVVCRMHDAENNERMNPRVVSLGPCHHGRQELQHMERQKTIAARQFVLSCRVDVQTCYKKVEEVLDRARESYAPEITNGLSTQAFKRMMFLDGCFVAYFIEKSNQGAIELEVDIPLIVRDIFLLENQLPFAVLDALMKLRFNSSRRAKQHIIKFITRQTTLTIFHYSNGLPRWLRRFWRGLWPSGLFGSGDDEALHLLDILQRMLLISPIYRMPKGDEVQRYTAHQLRSVVELKDDGIEFGRNNSGSLTDVHFYNNLFLPRILLPEMFINDATISQMVNLIAFELCFDRHSDAGVSSFLKFMESLINRSDDVKELRAKGILHHNLCSDHDVAKLFHDLPVDNSTAYLQAYRNVERDVVRHRDSRMRVHVARWSRIYFGNPWAAVTSFAAMFLLLLATLQTVFTVFPRK